jgi:hypothetical protein
MPTHRTSSSATRGGSAVAVALLASTRLHVLSAAREFSHPFERGHEKLLKKTRLTTMEEYLLHNADRRQIVGNPKTFPTVP